MVRVYFGRMAGDDVNRLKRRFQQEYDHACEQADGFERRAKALLDKAKQLRADAKLKLDHQMEVFESLEGVIVESPEADAGVDDVEDEVPILSTSDTTQSQALPTLASVAREVVAGLKGRFTARQVRDMGVRKHPHLAGSPNSNWSKMLISMERDGFLYIVEKGAGKRATVYGKVAERDAASMSNMK